MLRGKSEDALVLLRRREKAAAEAETIAREAEERARVVSHRSQSEELTIGSSMSDRSGKETRAEGE